MSSTKVIDKGKLEKEFEDRKEKIKDLIKTIKKMFLENQQLHNEGKLSYLSQQENQIEINKFTQNN